MLQFVFDFGKKLTLAHGHGFCPSGFATHPLAVNRLLNPLAVRRLHLYHLRESQKPRELPYIDQTVAIRRCLNFAIAAMRPTSRVRHHAGADHVEIDVNKAAREMIVALHGRRKIPVFPERTLAVLAPIELLRRSASHKLHAAGDLASSPVKYQ